MDFNIDNEKFAAAYRCLRNANELLEVGLGDFNELNDSALSLVGLDGRSNNDRLTNIMYKCGKLKDNMYNTIKYLSMMDASAAEFFADILNDGGSDGADGIDSEYLKYLEGEGTTEEQFRRIIELTQNGTKINDGATGFQIRGHEIYYDSESNQFYYMEDRNKENENGYEVMIYHVAIRHNLDSEYLLENIEDITGGKVQSEITFDLPNKEDENYDIDFDSIPTIPMDIKDIEGI